MPGACNTGAQLQMQIRRNRPDSKRWPLCGVCRSKIPQKWFLGVSLEAVTPAKQRVISRVAQFYLTVKYNSVDVPCRFDVVGIDGDRLQWKKNAFEYQTGMKI